MHDTAAFAKKIKQLESRIKLRDYQLLTSAENIGFLLERFGQAGVVVVNRDGEIIYVSERAEQLLGVREKNLVGKSYVERIFIYDNDGYIIPPRKQLVWEALHTANYKRVTPFFCFYGPPDKRLHIAMTAAVMRDGNEVGMVALTMREVKRVLNVDEMKSLFVSFAAHQLKTPSSITKGFLELLVREGKAAYTKRQWEHLESAYEANESLINLSKALLNLTKLEGGLMEPKLSVINPREVIEKKKFSHKLLSGIKEVRIELVADGAEQYFETDEMIFSELFDILFSNAIKFSPPGGVVTISLNINNTGLRLSVADQGPGISAEQQERLFTTTFKSDPASSGHGLGLVMAKKYAALLGGTITLVSEVGKGAMFTLFLPKPLA